MGLTITEKIIRNHLLEGEMQRGEPVSLRIDQTLTQDATGTMAYLELEAMGIRRVKTELSVAYVDHNTLQTGFENPDDHRYLQSVTRKYGVYFSRPGNGICHQVHLERFAAPGKTLIGSDSHTPTAGGLGMLAMGAGGLDVAAAMAGRAYRILMPRVFSIRVTGKLPDFVSAKDVSLFLLQKLTVKGGVGAVMEWSGTGLATLSVPERATIANMGTELGATSTVFPSDDVTYDFLRRQGRADAFVPISADDDAVYDRIIDIDLSAIEPMIACPHSPDAVRPVSALAGIRVDQVCVGSCTNSSLKDMRTAAALLRGKHISPSVTMGVSPGSKQVLTQLSSNGDLTAIIASGARLLESACGPCIGMGFAPNSGGVSLRTFNRNFEGRSGTKTAGVYLCSPETAVASAIAGVVTDPRTLGNAPAISLPEHFIVDDAGILPPLSPEEAETAEVLRGPNIKPMPDYAPITGDLSGPAALKVGDNITTDHIMPAGAKVLPYRSNVPKISEFCFGAVDPEFASRGNASGDCFIVGGINYGQGSSREHAALAPRYLGVRAVVVKSFARIHKANLVNAGILPLTFANPADYDTLEKGDILRLEGISAGLESGSMTLVNETKNTSCAVLCEISAMDAQILRAGNYLNYIRETNHD